MNRWNFSNQVDDETDKAYQERMIEIWFPVQTAWPWFCHLLTKRISEYTQQQETDKKFKLSEIQGKEDSPKKNKQINKIQNIIFTNGSLC